jgi:hypothetical protein
LEIQGKEGMTDSNDMPALEPMTPEDFKANTNAVLAYRVRIAEAEDELKRERKEWEAERAPKTGYIAAMKERVQELFEPIRAHVIASVKAGAPSTFGGWQAKRKRVVRYADKLATARSLLGMEVGGKPIVKWEIDERAMLDYIDAMTALGAAPEGVSVDYEWTVAEAPGAKKNLLTTTFAGQFVPTPEGFKAFANRITCLACGDDNIRPSWRWSGERWEHKCRLWHQQSGHDILPQGTYEIEEGAHRL